MQGNAVLSGRLSGRALDEAEQPGPGEAHPSPSGVPTELPGLPGHTRGGERPDRVSPAGSARVPDPAPEGSRLAGRLHSDAHAFLPAFAGHAIGDRTAPWQLPSDIPTLHLRARDLPAGCIPMLMLSCLLLPATRLAIGRPPGNCHPTSWPGRLRRGIFLALKITLVQPIMLCGFFVLIWMGPIPFAPQLGVCAYWILALRWVLLDQRRRCPVCLRLLTNPVRIGAPSETFL